MSVEAKIKPDMCMSPFLMSEPLMEAQASSADACINRLEWYQHGESMVVLEI